MGNNRRIKETVIFIIAVALIYGLMQLAGITCPIRYLTGISCPGCGMTRAVISVLKGNFAASFHYHALWPVAIVIGFIVVFGNKRIRSSRLLLYGALLVFGGYYLYRMFYSDHSIVSFNPTQGLIYRVFALIMNY